MEGERLLEARARATLLACMFTLFAFGANAATAHASTADRWAQIADTAFQNIAEDNDLPNAATPYALAQDGSGFMWIGSENGLARYDGYRFRLFEPDRAKMGSLLDGSIKTLHVDRSGRLWIGTNSGGLARYDALRDRFVNYTARTSGLRDDDVWAIADDGTLGVYVGTGRGLDRLDTGSGRVVHIAGPWRHGAAVTALLRDRSGALWVGTASGLYRRRAGVNAFTAITLPGTRGRIKVWSLAEDERGGVWAGTTHAGAYVVLSGASRARAIRETALPGSSLGTAWITSIAAAGPGEVWLGTGSQGIVVVDTTTLHTREIRHDPTLPATLSSDGVRTLLRDRSGLLWTGTERSLSIVDPRHTAIRSIFGLSRRPNGITDPAVNSVLVRRNGRVWLGLGANGVDILDPLRGRVGALRPDARHAATALPNNHVNAMVEAGSGDVYLGTDNGLYVARAGRGVARVNVAGRPPEQAVSALYLDGRVLWVGGPAGISALALAGSVAVLARVPSLTGRLTDPRVRVIARGAGNDLWIGTENGLDRFDLRSGALERFGRSVAGSDGLAGAFVSSLLLDRRGRLWVGSDGGGLSVLDRPAPGGRWRFRRLGKAEGLPNDDIAQMLEVPGGNVWLATDNGLAIVNDATFAIRPVGRSDGVDVGSYWIGSGAATAQGELLFGGVAGLTVVRPRAYAAWTYRPPLAITEIRVAGKPVLAQAYASARPLVIAPGGNNFSVEFAALDYSAPAFNRYAYRLDGFDRTWIEADSVHRSATYGNLPPGSYTLYVRGSNRNGVYTETALELPIRVLPDWYQTLGFRVAAIASGLLAVFLVISLRTRLLRARARQLEAEVAQRTAELRASHAQLEQLAYIDTLTNLPNRRMFNDEFHRLVSLAKRHGSRFALVLIDLDRFKWVNDTLGHDAGDRVLVETGRRIRAAVRSSDTVARLGGDEFAILLTEPHEEAAVEATCDRILGEFTAAQLYKGEVLPVTPSIGIALYPDDGVDESALYRSADLALYAAKRNGRNTWRLYTADMGG